MKTVIGVVQYLRKNTHDRFTFHKLEKILIKFNSIKQKSGELTRLLSDFAHFQISKTSEGFLTRRKS